MAPLPSFDEMCLLIGRKEAEKFTAEREHQKMVTAFWDGHHLKIKVMDAAYQECSKLAAEEMAKLAAENAELRKRLEAAEAVVVKRVMARVKRLKRSTRKRR